MAKSLIDAGHDNGLKSSIPRPKEHHPGGKKSAGKKYHDSPYKTDIAPVSETDTEGDKSDIRNKYKPTEYFERLLHPEILVTLFCVMATLIVGVKGTALFLSIYGAVWVLLFAAARTIAKSPVPEEPFFMQWEQSRIALALGAVAFALSGPDRGNLAPYFLISFCAVGCGFTDLFNMFKTSPHLRGDRE